MGTRSQSPLEDVPAENVSAAPAERPTGELATERGGKGEEPVRNERGERNGRARSAKRSEAKREHLFLPSEEDQPNLGENPDRGVL